MKRRSRGRWSWICGLLGGFCLFQMGFASSRVTRGNSSFRLYFGPVFGSNDYLQLCRHQLVAVPEMHKRHDSTIVLLYFPSQYWSNAVAQTRCPVVKCGCSVVKKGSTLAGNRSNLMRSQCFLQRHMHPWRDFELRKLALSLAGEFLLLVGLLTFFAQLFAKFGALNRTYYLRINKARSKKNRLGHLSQVQPPRFTIPPIIWLV